MGMAKIRDISGFIFSRIAVGVTLYGALVAGSVMLYGQSTPMIPLPVDSIMPSVMTRDPWFWVFVGWYGFSAIVTGMPEPNIESSPWYIWAYRSFHILAASGTSFFSAKAHWPKMPEAAMMGNSSK